MSLQANANNYRWDWLGYFNISKEWIEAAENYQMTCTSSSDLIKCEALLRSSVSRTYYYTFNLLKSFLSKKNFKTPKKNAHKVLIENLRKYCEQIGDDLEYFGENLKVLRDMRVDADYKDSCPINELTNYVKDAIYYAQEFEEFVRTH